jgi:hypothetical protein
MGLSDVAGVCGVVVGVERFEVFVGGHLTGAVRLWGNFSTSAS